ncbi:FAD-dependent oxidoreductase [Tropicibacter sp. R16_0]|uniref:FAD-dependent oxidoreductase n=1 Tax=Tropicibacter sp. R16_0 TaxID=2821102 RepID=UPI001ADBB326|nr:FAD-dependent oxidoreductase [Tropicibacter sp. R16_0]MBO9451438.1 FAD-dependent oxidoreductase [Tropicibacter sp. R16_0]
MSAGVKSVDFQQSAVLTEFIGNHEGSTKRAKVSMVAAQLLASGPIAERMAQLENQVSGGIKVYVDTKAELDLEAGVDGDNGAVISGVDRGLYRHDGTNWVKTSDLPPGWVEAVNQEIANADLEDVPEKTIKGRAANGTGEVADLTVAEVLTLIGLNEVDNTRDVDKPVSTAQQEALDGKATAEQGEKADSAVQPDALSAALTGKSDTNHRHSIGDVEGLKAELESKATSAQGQKADTAVQPGGLSAALADVRKDFDLGLVSDAERAETRAAFTSDLSGDPLARKPIEVGTVQVSALMGAVLRINGETDASNGFVDVSRRSVWPVEPEAIYRIRVQFARAADPVDPSGHSVELRLQSLGANKGTITSQRLTPVMNPVVADGVEVAECTVSTSDLATYQLPDGARYFTPFLRIYGDAHQLDVASIEVINITELQAVKREIAEHLGDTDNPHGVTKAQVGLGNVDNTRDLDKPVSTAQQAALDGKATTAQGAKADSAVQPGDLSAVATSGSAEDLTEGATRKLMTPDERAKVGHVSVSAPTDLDALRTRVDDLDSAVTLKGEWDAGSGAFPAGAMAGHAWIVSGDGQVDGQDFAQTDRLIALVDGASTSTYADNWHKADYSDKVSSVNGRGGAVNLDPADVGLDQVDNTPDTDKPVSTPQQDALDQKPDRSELAAEVAARTALVTDTGTAEVPGIGPVSAFTEAGPDGAVSEATRASDGRMAVISKDGTLDIVATEKHVDEVENARAGLVDDVGDAEVPGIGAVSSFSETGPDGAVSEATRASDGRKAVIGKKGKLDLVATDEQVDEVAEAREDLIDEIGPAVVPGVGEVSEFSEAGPDGEVSEATRKSDGGKFFLGSNGRLARVATVEDLVETTDEDPMIVPGVGQPAEIAQTPDGELAYARSKLGHTFKARGGKMVRDTAPRYDLLIYGEGLAALTAARMASDLGLSVCLVCPRDRVGGMMSGGISDADMMTDGTSSTLWRQYTGGYTDAFFTEMNGVHHGYYWQPKLFQARAAQAVANRWAAEYCDRVILNSPIHDAFQSMGVERGRITYVNTSEGPVQCGQMIDASYTGDAIRAAGVSWTATREAISDEEPEGGFNWAGRSTIATGLDVKAAALDMGFSEVPAEAFDLAGVTRVADTSGLPADGTAEVAQMAFHCRSNITDAPDRIPFADRQPEGYDRRRYVIALAEAKAKSATDIWDVIAQQGGDVPVITGQTSVTIANTNSGLTGAFRLPGSYATATWSERRTIERDVIGAWVGFLYFFATDAAVAAELPALQASVQDWGWDPREWIGSPYGDGIPHMAYERETIRLVNDHVLTRADLQVAWDDPAAPADPVGLFRYKFDTKALRQVAIDAEGDGSNVTLAHEGFASSGLPATYAIPLSACLPRADECRNLGVAWCVATTHIAWRSLRMEPSGGMMGEALAAAAALALEKGIALQAVDYADVREILLARRAVLSV